jgi:hypothetical protein
VEIASTGKRRLAMTCYRLGKGVRIMYNLKKMKTTQYFQYTRQRPDRAMIQDEWIEWVIQNPLREEIQSDGRIRRWARIAEMENRVLRVILLEDGETVHNAFFDRNFKE